MKNIISIETSCDETAIAVMSFEENQNLKEQIEFNVLSNHVLSQINIHREFGGVFPMLAKREHAKNIVKIFTECLKEANLYKEKKEKVEDINWEENNENIFKDLKNKFNYEKIEKIRILLERELEMFGELMKLVLNIEKPNIDSLVVTSGPGLAPALWVGINFAKALSIFWDIEIYPINHMEGHILSSLVSPISENKYLIKNFEKPALALLISGGHTEINYFEELGKYKKIGQTVDDAVGEAFDKVARSLNLPYPGGPEISKIAESCRINNLEIIKEFKLPRPMINSKDLNFSFSGLKTAVIYKIKELEKSMQEKDFSNEIIKDDIKNIISLDFENAVTEILLKKIKDAMLEYSVKSLVIGGGVIANSHIRKSFTDFAKIENIDLYIPERFLAGDNAFMIGLVGIVQILKKKNSIYIGDIKADSNWSLENI